MTLRNFEPSKKYIIEAANSLTIQEGHTLYNLNMNYNENDKEYSNWKYIMDFGKKHKFYPIDSNSFRKLFDEYDNFCGIKKSVWERQLSNYVDIIRLVGNKWMEINLPDEIDLYHDEIIITNEF